MFAKSLKHASLFFVKNKRTSA